MLLKKRNEIGHRKSYESLESRKHDKKKIMSRHSYLTCRSRKAMSREAHVAIDHNQEAMLSDS